MERTTKACSKICGKIRTWIKESDMDWLRDRLKERTTLDGFVLVVAGAAMVIAPVNLIAYAMIAYGAWTMWKSE